MELTINGQTYEVASTPDRPLLWVLRDELGLTGTKYGCGVGICGSCTVHVDGLAVRSCITSLSALGGKLITTIEGLSISPGDKIELHKVQKAFLEEQVPQCGWCMPGQMMTAAAFLAKNPDPSDEQIRQAMNAIYCRCGTYDRIRKAVRMAAEMAGESQP